MSDADYENELGFEEYQAASLLAYALAAVEKLAESGAPRAMLKQAITAEMDELAGIAGDLIEAAREAAYPSELAGPLRRREPRQHGHLRLVPPIERTPLAGMVAVSSAAICA